MRILDPWTKYEAAKFKAAIATSISWAIDDLEEMLDHWGLN